MNEKVRQHLIAYNQKNNWSIENDSLIETITEGPVVYEEKVSESRWWNNEFRVTKIDGMFIGYGYAQANRDESIRDLGWEFDESTICEVEPVEKTVIVYKKVNPASKEGVINTMNNLDPITKQPDELKKEAEHENAQESLSQDQAMEVQDSEEGTTEG